MIMRTHVLILRIAAIIGRATDPRILEYATRVLAKLLPSADGLMAVAVGKGQFAFSLKDDYWVRLLHPLRDYEPEIHIVLDWILESLDVVFIDAGANKGYWSVFVGSHLQDPTRTIAIEASPPTFECLHHNAALNEGRFTCLNAAVYSTSGQQATITTVGGEHAGASLLNRPLISNRPPTRESWEVTSITIDDIVKSTHIHMPVVVKLDVEGVEVEAIMGASQTITNRPTLIVYEDHGADALSSTTDFVLAQGMNVYHVNANANVSQIRNISQVSEIKVDRFRGYNFFATQPDSVFDELFARRGRRFTHID